MEEGAFDGIRVVELAQWVFVPVAGALLADWGADVVRIERPEGDPYRGLMTQGIGTDRRRREPVDRAGQPGQALDRPRPAHRGRARGPRTSCSPSADVFLTNFRPGALERLGLDAETLRGALPDAGLRPRPRLRRARSRRRHAGLRRVGVLGPRRRRRTCSRPPERDYPISQRGAMGDRNGGDGAGVRHRGRAAQARRAPARARSSTCRCSPPRCGRCRPTCSPRCRARQPRAMSTGAGGCVNPLVGVVPHEGRPPHPAGVPRGRPLLARLLPADRPRRPGRRPALRRPRGPRREHAEECVAELDAEFAHAHVRRSGRRCSPRIDAPWAPVQAVEELLDDPQVIANGYIGEVDIDGGPSYRLPDGAGAVRRAAARAAPRARARRAHRGDPARARLHVGRDRRAAGRRG